METGNTSSLVVKLPLRICDTCTDVLSRWMNPSIPRHGYEYDGLGSNWPVSEDRFEKQRNDMRWTWKVKNLKSSAKKCVFCRFLVQCVDSSPWMPYEDDDYIELEPRFVGSTHTDLHDRQKEDNQARWNNGSFRSAYKRFNRPRLQLFKKQAGDQKRNLYTPGDYVFILPLSISPKGQEWTSHAQSFQGRVVEKYANLALVQDWITTCKVGHIKSKMPQPNYRGSTPVEDCVPVQKVSLPHFRLVDIWQKCVVMPSPEELNPDYAALSYVWGNSQRLLLCSKTLKKLSTPNALSYKNEKVPKTFRDAIAIAEKLRIRYLWIDAICILQDNEQQLVEHMNSMDSIYGSAILTIVSDTNSAESGVPGVGHHRQFDQARFQWGDQSFISSKRTFGKALTNSAWESRAWCLQEKVFSKRLLIFTDTQAFYHCSCATWFEDTIMENKIHTGGSIYIAERSSPSRKSARGPSYTAYEAHLPAFSRRNFWTLVETYSLRQLSFEVDTIRAFSGILKSLESVYGPAVWGVPQYMFGQGLTWSLSPHKADLRRKGFPSWSWAGWRGNTGSTLRFIDVLARNFGIWGIEWNYYRFLDDKGDYELTAVQDSKIPDAKIKQTVKPKPHSSSSQSSKADTSSSSSIFGAPQPSLFKSSSTFGSLACRPKNEIVETAEDKKIREEEEKRSMMNHTWCLSGHPGESDYVQHPIPPINHDPAVMPPLSHFLRFYTSCATVIVDPDPDPEHKTRVYQPINQTKDLVPKHHRVRLPNTSETIFHIQLDPDSPGKGKQVKLIYISKGFYEPDDDPDDVDGPELLNVMLIEGDGEVKMRVQCFFNWSIDHWRKAKPVWELITLA